MEQIIIITTSETIENHKIKEYLGMVSARNWAPNATVQFDSKKKEKNIDGYRKLIADAESALQMEAKHKGANAVVGVSVECTSVTLGQMITLYGTAVRIE